MAQRYFAAINPGLEAALLEEVRELGGKRASAVVGGVEFDATTAVFYRVAQQVRCANRLWLRVDEFRARDAPELFNKTKRVEWARLIPVDAPVQVRAATHGSRLNLADRIAGAVGDAIDESLGRERVERGEPLTVLARLVDNRCELSLDASGDLLYRRGYKTEAVAAPLRESVAAAILRIVGWQPGEALWDPFCGSGTIVIEAAQRAAGVAANAARSLDLQRWANFRADVWASLPAPAAAVRVEPACHGSDIDPVAVEAARHNAHRGGVAELCRFSVADAAEALGERNFEGWIVTNPPWNLRLADPTLEALSVVAKNRGAARLAVVAPRRWQAPGGKERARFELGGTPVTLWSYED